MSTQGNNRKRTTLHSVGGTQPKRGKKQRGISKDLTLLERVVLAKFPPDANPPYRSDSAVARMLGLTKHAVGALVKEAFNRGLVEPTIKLSEERRNIAHLEDALRRRYGLQQVWLAPGLPQMLEPLAVEQRRNVQTLVLHQITELVVKHLDTLLMRAAHHRDQFTLGVAWGRTLRMVVEQLRSTSRPVRLPGLEVLPIVGITCESLHEPTEANFIARDIAGTYGGKSSQLACPAFIPKEDVWIVTQRLQQVRRVLRQLPACNVVITGMGPIPDDENAVHEINLSVDRAQNAELFMAARTWNAIGEICYWAFNGKGEEVPTTCAAVGLGFKGLQTIAADPKRQVILVTGGDQRRFRPLHVALRAGLASVLVSDTVTAAALIGYED